MVAEGCDEVIPRRAGVPPGVGRHIRVAPGEVGHRCVPQATVQGDSVGPPHPHTSAHSTWMADPNSLPQWAGSRGRDSALPQTPLTMVEGTPPGDALPPPPQRATPARKGARCGTGARSPSPRRPHPEHRVAEPWLPAPEDGRPGEGQRLTPGAPHNCGRHP